MKQLESVTNNRETIVHNQICTPDGTVLVSRHTHDYKTHKDLNGLTYMVDGGLSYLRRNIHKEFPYKEMSLYVGDEHSRLRELVTWGCWSSGVLKYIPIKQMSRAHITNIVSDGYTGSHVDIMINEIEWRDEHETVSESKRLEIQRENSYG